MKELTFGQSCALADLIGGKQGKDGRARLLVRLAETHPHPNRMGEIAHKMRTSVAAVSSVINTLAKAGWVERSELDGDRRVVLVGVTAKALKAIERAASTGGAKS